MTALFLSISRLNENALRQLLSPEDVCMLESAMEAAHRLKELHVARLVSPEGLERVFDRLKGSVVQKVRKRAIAIFIEEELQLVPWTLSANFHHFMHGRCQLALRGVADPSGRGEAHAYTRLERRSEAVDEGAAVPRRVEIGRHTGGTDSDLRKLTVEGCVRWLVPHGYTRDQVMALSRWDRIAAIRAIATKQAAEGLAPRHQFARVQRVDMQAIKADYAALAASIWRAQLAALGATEPPGAESDDESDEDDFENQLLNDMEGQAPEVVHEGQDARELEAMREERAGGGAAPKPAQARAPAAAGAVGGPARRMVKTGRKILRVKQWIEEPDSGFFKEQVTEYTMDTEEGKRRINEYIKKQRKEARRNRMVLSAEEEHQERERKREMHRVQESLRRERERARKLLEMQQQLKSGVALEGDGGGAGRLRCSACGMIGHTKNSKNCPLYSETQKEEKAEMSFNQGLVRQLGQDRAGQLKLSISAKVQEQALKVKINHTKTKEYKDKLAEEEFRTSVRGGNRSKAGAASSSSRSRRKAGSAEVKLNGMLEEIVSRLRRDAAFADFVEPVAATIKGYLTLIKSPMDLKTMTYKCKQVDKQQPYARLSEFKADLALIVSNCHEFNTKFNRNLHLEPVARRLESAGLEMLEHKRADLEELEAALVEREAQVAAPIERRVRILKPPGTDGAKKRQKHIGGAAAAAAAAYPAAINANASLPSQGRADDASGMSGMPTGSEMGSDSESGSVQPGTSGMSESMMSESLTSDAMSDVDAELQSLGGSDSRGESRGGGSTSVMSSRSGWSADDGSVGSAGGSVGGSTCGSIGGSIGGSVISSLAGSPLSSVAPSDDEGPPSGGDDASSEIGDLSSMTSPGASSVEADESEMEDDWTDAGDDTSGGGGADGLWSDSELRGYEDERPRTPGVDDTDGDAGSDLLGGDEDNLEDELAAAMSD